MQGHSSFGGCCHQPNNPALVVVPGKRLVTTPTARFISIFHIAWVQGISLSLLSFEMTGLMGFSHVIVRFPESLRDFGLLAMTGEEEAMTCVKIKIPPPFGAGFYYRMVSKNR